MAIRNIGSSGVNTTDLQNDNVKPQPSQPTAQPTSVEKISVPSAQSQMEKSLRARNTMGSLNMRAALDAQLGSKRILVGQAFQTPVANLVRGTAKINEATGKYRSHIENQLNGIKGSTQEFLSSAKDSHSSLLAHRQALTGVASSALIGHIDNLANSLATTIKNVHTSTNDFLYDSHSKLNELSYNANKLQTAAQSMAKGDATAIKTAQQAFNKVSTLPSQINSQADSFSINLNKLMSPLVSENSKPGMSGNIFSQVGSAIGGFFKGLVDQGKAALKDLGQTAVQDVKQGLATNSFSLKGLATDLADKAYKFKYDIKDKVGGFVDEWVNPLLKIAGSGLSGIFGKIFGSGDKSPAGKGIPQNELVKDTQDLRDMINGAKAGNTAAITKLQQQYGYTPANAPKPGQMWLSANHVLGDLDNNKVTAQHFPATGNTDATPADPSKMFANGKTVTLRDVNGKETQVTSMAQYQTIVAANREKLGIPANDGKPMSVQLTLEGGGGRGKRYASMLEEMANVGIFPASVSGSSAGAITASLVAAGIDPKGIDQLEKDPALGKFFDVHLGKPGLLEGKALYNYMDQRLRQLTGITDRPVTFADLPRPLYLTATKLADSAAPNDMTNPKDRQFVFSKETTPDTPVVMALVASASIPAAFDPADMVDPATGRTIRLVDGGVLNNLPVNIDHNNLPEIAVDLGDVGDASRSRNNAGNPQSLPPGNLISNDVFGNAKIGLDLQAKNDTGAQDFNKLANPPKGVFALSVPTYQFGDLSKSDTTFNFGYDKGIDDPLDKQTFKVTDNFLKQYFTQFSDPNASGTNLKPPVGDVSFSRSFEHNGAQWTATRQAGSDYVDFTSNKGDHHHLNLDKDRLVTWINEDGSFNDLADRLQFVLADREKFAFGV